MTPKGNKLLTKITIIKDITSDQKNELLKTLKTRFENNMKRHKGVKWESIQKKLEKNHKKLISLYNMEQTSGEPDVISFNPQSDEYIFFDCSFQTPMGRRNICYDLKGQEEREKKGIYPKGNAIELATLMGIELLTEESYRKLQTIEEFDSKSSSWIKTPEEIRKLGGALFCDRRFGKVFVYHNTAPTFYSSRAFRGLLRV